VGCLVVAGGGGGRFVSIDWDVIVVLTVVVVSVAAAAVFSFAAAVFRSLCWCESAHSVLAVMKIGRGYSQHTPRMPRRRFMIWRIG